MVITKFGNSLSSEVPGGQGQFITELLLSEQVGFDRLTRSRTTKMSLVGVRMKDVPLSKMRPTDCRPFKLMSMMTRLHNFGSGVILACE